MHKEIETYGDLLKFLQNNPSILQQPIQIVKPSPIEEEVQTCMPGIAIGTVESFQFYRIRSTHNNKFCPEDLVILVDGNPFGRNGEIAYEIDSFKDAIKNKPVYSASGPTKIEEQTDPDFFKKEVLEAENLTQSEIDIVKNRAKQ